MQRYFILIFFWVVVTTGCNLKFLPDKPPPKPTQSPYFVMVKVGPQDSPASLARSYLKDEDKAWIITTYNDIDALTPGQQIVIPKKPINYGGIRQDSYQTVPILYYPEISSGKKRSKALHANDFELQMDYLNGNGYTTISLDQFHAFLNLEEAIPVDAVIISFDTNRRWVYETAFPILRRRGMKASLFIRLNEVGAKGKLTWLQLAEMASSGFDIGIYGTPMKAPEKKDLKSFFNSFDKEFSSAKIAFKKHLKIPCRYFAYYRGKSNDLTIAMLKKHGFHLAFTRKRGNNPFYNHNYKIKRTLISGHYNMNRFKKTLVTFKPAELR